MINTNLHHRFEVIADYCSNFGRKTATMVIKHRRLAPRILLSVTKSKCMEAAVRTIPLLQQSSHAGNNTRCIGLLCRSPL